MATETEVNALDLPVETPAPRTDALLLDSQGAVQMTSTALRAHATALLKLSKSARDLTQDREAKVFEQQAAVIFNYLLPQLTPQREIPLGHTDLRKAIEHMVGARLWSRVRSSLEATVPHGDSAAERDAYIDERITDLQAVVSSVLDVVSAVVAPVVAQAAESGLVAGRLARETTPVTLGLEAVSQVMDRA